MRDANIGLMWILILWTVLAAGCSRGPRKPVPAPPNKPRPAATATLTEVHPFQVDEKGRKLWEANAKTLQASESQKTIDLVKASAVLYHEGKPEITLVAPRMHANYQTGVLELSGGVKAESRRRNMQFQVGEMIWNARTGKLIGKKGIQINRGKAVITGGRMEGDTRLKKVMIFDNPHIMSR